MSSLSQWGKTKHIACWNVLNVMSHSPWFLTDLAGLVCLNLNLKSPNISKAQLSETVEWILENMMSKSTTFPCRTLTHSESGNSGSPLMLNRLCFMTLISAMWFLTNFHVSSWLGMSLNICESSLVVQVKSDSSALPLSEATCRLSPHSVICGDHRSLLCSGLCS